MTALVDTHCHIHEAVVSTDDDPVQSKWAKGGFSSPQPLIEGARDAGVNTLICIGCTLNDSLRAIQLAQKEAACFASIGIHPHEAHAHNKPEVLRAFMELATEEKVVAVGECGLDYFYEHSPKKDQYKVLEFQLQLAQDHGLPVSFHVREAFDDFWPIFDNFKGLRGVLHSFTDNLTNLDKAISRGLYIGLNGIMTFTKDEKQHTMAKSVPVSRLLLETDAPFLTPTPYRGKICEPKHVVETARFLSDLRGQTLEELAAATTANAEELFRFNERLSEQSGTIT